MKNNEIHVKHEKLTNDIYISENMLPSRYVLVLTNLCNLRCSFCFQEKKSSPNSMSTSEWINIIKQFPKYSRVTLTGGEPFIFKGFKEVFHEVASNYDCNIISNGLPLDRELIDYLLSYDRFKTLSISVDTVRNINRNVKPKDWDKLMDVLNYFIQKSFILLASTN